MEEVRTSTCTETNLSLFSSEIPYCVVCHSYEMAFYYVGNKMYQVNINPEKPCKSNVTCST